MSKITENPQWTGPHIDPPVSAIETDSVIVSKADLNTLLSRIDEIQEEMKEIRAQNRLRNRVEALAKGSTLDAPAICKLLNWSRRTFYRRAESGTIPVSQEGGNRYKISVDNFLKWYKENYEL
ncbi:MAG: helix-turn-helix domain-containing protein [Marinilabiliaceae bacterium]